MNIVAIPRAEIAAWWPQIEPGLAEVLKLGMGRQSTDQVLDNLQHKRWLLFMVMADKLPAACFVVRVEARIFEIGMCWGEHLTEWLDDILTAFVRVGRELDCDKLAINGRPGWVKLGKARGFNVKSVTIVRDI